MGGSEGGRGGIFFMGGQRSTSGVIRVKGEGVDQRVGRGEVILGRGGKVRGGNQEKG